MSYAPVETAEENAADLQFPKENRTIYDVCRICGTNLNVPYITCAECKPSNLPTTPSRFTICLKCFSMGAETEDHLSNHSYAIIHNNVKIFRNSSWPAREDMLLIELISRYGFANWSDISRKIEKYSAVECRNQYLQNYFGGLFWRTCQLTNFPYCRINVPYLFYRSSLDPPRKSDMIQAKLMADYQFARSDFDTQFDNSAEGVISGLTVNNEWNNEFKSITDNLNCALVTAYNNRLRERYRRHKIVRNHALILPNRTKSWLAKYAKSTDLKKPDDHSYSGRFDAFMQLTSGIDFDRILEGLQYEYDLRKFLNRLYDLRAKGITTCRGGRLFQSEKNYQTSIASDKPYSLWEWKQISVNKKDSLSGAEKIMKHCMDLDQLPKKRRSTPLNIIGLTNYEQLCKDEQELCSIIRIIPNAYLIYKKLLITENNKLGYMRLADARRLIKIDVNKTRVLYDFFFEKGYINKPSQ